MICLRRLIINVFSRFIKDYVAAVRICSKEPRICTSYSCKYSINAQYDLSVEHV